MGVRKWYPSVALFCVLVVSTRIYWNSRFEAVQGIPMVSVEAGDKARICVERLPGERRIVRSIDLPLGSDVETLHIQFSYRAVHILEGTEKWENGRMILDWHDQDGRLVAHDVIINMRGHDENPRHVEMIVPAKQPDSVPKLRIEHLGVSGSMEINDLKVMSVRISHGYAAFAFVLVILWGFFFYMFVGCLSEVSWHRRLIASVVLMAMGWFLVVPGPWVHPRPLAGAFLLGPNPEEQRSVVLSIEKNKTANDLEPLGSMPVQGSWLIQVKVLLSFLRPVLHIILFAGPAFFLAVCCGTRCAWWASVAMVLMVEAAQAAFWLSVDWLDVMDLAVDFMGIGAALWIYRKIISNKQFNRWVNDGVLMN